MEKIRYRRDLPDGSKQYSDEPIEKPSINGNIYFDDIILKTENKKINESLEIKTFGNERSYPNRTLDRRTDDYILHYVTGGSGIFNGERIGAGQGFLVIADVPHYMCSDAHDPWRFKWVAFNGSDAMRHMKDIGLDIEAPYFLFDFSERLEALFDDVIYSKHDDCDPNMYMLGIFYILMSYHKKQYVGERHIERTVNRYAKKAIRYIDGHFKENIRVDDIAKDLHVSRKYLCTLIEREIGMSTKDYILTRRTDYASDLLEYTSMTVSEIAAEVGYGDYTQFSRLFRTKKGLSPQQFRSLKRKEASQT